MKKVYVAPQFSGKDKADGGIRRVIDALIKYLPQFGWEVTDKLEEADVVHTHAGNTVEAPTKPTLNSSHGLYWSDYDWADWAAKANAELMQAMAWANAHTAPSKWVANAIRRGTLYNPEVIYHGVEADDFKTKKHQGFVLWNKARQDVISDPKPVRKLAELMPDVTFVTTVLDDWSSADPKKNCPPNVDVCGVMSYGAMKQFLPFAGVYLATTRETFGIGTLEAMACGVPVAGWDYGGQREIIIDGETGYLAPYGDYDSLAECVRNCLADRDRLSVNCLVDIRKRWGWKDKIRQYADLYDKLYYENKRRTVKVSVIIPCYNLAAFLPQAVKSVQAQTLQAGWELIIVDDCSTDATWHVAKEMESWDGRIRVYKTPKNVGLCGTRNFGISKAKGKYIQFLDADDLLTPHALAICSEVLDNEPGIHIAYGHLDVINEHGTSAYRNDWPQAQFSWYRQMAHLNEPHYSAMVRKSVYDLAGGYRWRHRKAEDAWFWCYVTSFGQYAEKVTDCTTLLWRSRSNSKSITERENDTDLDGDWTAEFPWSLAHSAVEANAKIMEEGDLYVTADKARLFPFGAQGAPPEGYFWDIWHNAEPKRTITINGLNLGEYCDENWQKLMNLLDPVRLSEDRDWKCVVYLPADWPKVIPGAAWAEIVLVNDQDTLPIDLKELHYDSAALR